MNTPPTQDKLLTPIHLRLVFWFCGGSFFVLALLPTSHALPTTGWDKSNHMLAFLTLTLLGLLAYPAKPLAMTISLVAYGGLIEVLQSFTPTRSAEWGDLLADAVGVGIGWLVLTGLHQNRRHH